MAQTPQGVRRSLLREALTTAGAEDGTWTDEAALLEACRIAVHVVPGDPANLKVTVPPTSTGPHRSSARIRSAADRRRPRRPSRSAPANRCDSVVSRSPGRRASTAIPMATSRSMRSPMRCSGRLGLATSDACSRRDRRRREASIAGRCSTTVVGRLRDAGWQPAAVDLTIVAGRPRLAGHLDAMAAAIAGALRLPLEAIGVKASTGNLEGAEGAGRAISALALATIEPTR